MEVVVLEEPIDVPLDLLDLDVLGHPARDPEALIEQRSIHPLDEPIGARGADLGAPMLDAFERQSSS